MLVFLRQDKGLQFCRIQSLVHIYNSQADSLPLREVVCPFFENEILPNTHFRRVLPGQNARNFGRENRDSLSCWHHTTVKIHLLKCLNHRNNSRTFLKVAIALSKL